MTLILPRGGGTYEAQSARIMRSIIVACIKRLVTPGLFLIWRESSPQGSAPEVRKAPHRAHRPHTWYPGGGRVTMHVIVHVAVARGTPGGGGVG